MKNKILVTFLGFLLILTACQVVNNNKLIDEWESSRTTFLLTDDVNEELSVLRVTLTSFKLINSIGNEFVVFSVDDGDDPFTINLLDLEDLNAMMGSKIINSDIYKEIKITYKDALALDNNGHLLNVLPQHFGTARILLNPFIQIKDDGSVFQIDFDLNNSVFNIVAKDKGSLMFMPTLIVKVNPFEGLDLSEFKGEITSLESMSFLMEANSSSYKIVLDQNTVVEVDELLLLAGSSGFDLNDYLKAGQIVEVYGTFNSDDGTVLAAYIERKFDNHGLESIGIITAFDNDSMELLILDPRDSGFLLGSLQTINFDQNTAFLYTDPYKIAGADNLHLGHKVRITGFPDDPNSAQKIKLKETKICGELVSRNQNILVVNVHSVMGISVDQIPGFSNPVGVEVVGDLPDPLASGDFIKLAGHFLFNFPYEFTAFELEIKNDEDDEETSEGEGGDGYTWVAKVFSVLSGSPLQISLTHGSKLDEKGNRSALAVVENTTYIYEKNGGTCTQITSGLLVQGINSGKYSKLKVEGTFDAATRTLTGKKIRADLAK